MTSISSYRVEICYSEKEVHEAFRHFFNDGELNAKMYVFTKNDLPFLIYGESDDVEVHSSGTLWEQLKSWITGEDLFLQHFNQFNITAEERLQFRSIIRNGGTIILTTEDESIERLLADHQKWNHSSISQKNQNVAKVYTTLSKTQLQPYEKPMFTRSNEIQYYADGPRKHHLHSYNLHTLSDEQKMQEKLERIILPFSSTDSTESVIDDNLKKMIYIENQKTTNPFRYLAEDEEYANHVSDEDSYYD